MDAVRALEFKTRKEAIEHISSAFGRNNNYLKLRRDEFDSLPGSSSTRKGWRNRPAAKSVEKLGEHLKQFSFDELTGIVKTFLSEFFGTALCSERTTRSVQADLSEEELEQIINHSDPDATIVFVSQNVSQRICDTSIVQKLKQLYRGQCQICGGRPIADSGVDICEAHHIEYYAESANNNASNIIILCPNHHRLIHKVNPKFNREIMRFTWPDGELKIQLDYHLNN